MEHLIALGTYAQTHVLAILICIVVGIAIGFIWHGPLFGQKWIKLNGLTPPKKGEATFGMMLPGFIAAIIMLFVQAMVMGRTFELVALTGIGQALLIAVVLWLPFTGLVILNSNAWLGKSWAHTAIDAGYNLVSMLAIAAILYSM